MHNSQLFDMQSFWERENRRAEGQKNIRNAYRFGTLYRLQGDDFTDGRVGRGASAPACAGKWQ